MTFLRIDVDKITYDEKNFMERSSNLNRLACFHNPEGRLYALCLKDSFDLISVLIYLRSGGGSALLIHADTPLEAARITAERAQCHYLVYGTWDHVIPVTKSPIMKAPSILQYSSGTTGEPKLITRSWKDIHEEMESYNARLLPAAAERPLVLVPVSHSFGLICGVLSALARESHPVIVQDKNPKFALHMIRSLEQTIVYGVPFQYHILESLGKKDLRFHKLVSSGSPLSPALLNVLERQSEEIWQQYGCTETGCVSLGPAPSSPYDVGQPLQHVQVSFLQGEGGAVSADMAGAQEIAVRIRDSVTHTQDLGFLSEKGSLHTVGRMDDLINVSGLKVLPAEVEDVIGRLPAVKEVVIHRKAHSIWGEAVKALIVASKDISKEEIRSYCMQFLPSFKVPHEIEMVSEIPRTASGKLSRKLLESGVNGNEHKR